MDEKLPRNFLLGSNGQHLSLSSMSDGRETSQELPVGGRLSTSLPHPPRFPLHQYRRLCWRNHSPSDGISLPM